MRRRRRRNPAGSTIALALVGAGVVGGIIFLAVRKANASPASLQIPGSSQSFVVTPQIVFPADQVPSLITGDCITVVNDAAGFHVDGINSGENVLCQITAPSGGGPTLAAMLRDPRLPGKQDVLVIPIGAISGAGTC